MTAWAKLIHMNMNLRYVFFATLLVLTFPSPGGAATGPKLVCDEPVYAFGQIDQSAVVTHIFIIRNEGDTTFAAGTPRATCGCTQVSINKQMIDPGETAELTAVFTAAHRSGTQKKPIYLSAQDSSDPVLIFYLEGLVDPPVNPPKPTEPPPIF